MSPARVTADSNPLRDPRDKRLPRIAGPCSLVLFGVTGDLARKKLMPAIYDLANRGLLPPGFALVGFARRQYCFVFVPRAAPKGDSDVRSPMRRRSCGGGAAVPHAAPIPPPDAGSPSLHADSPTAHRLPPELPAVSPEATCDFVAESANNRRSGGRHRLLGGNRQGRPRDR